MKLIGDWAKAAKIANGLDKRFQSAVARALAFEAQQIRGQIIKGIRSGAPAGKAFAPLSPMTVMLRRAGGFGGSKPLIRTGGLIRGISAVKSGDGWFVGVLRQAKSADGKSLANVGEIQEFGRTWTQRFTPKSRRFLFAMLRKAGATPSGVSKGSGGKGTVTITIPARPFIGPVVEQAQQEVAKRFWENVARGMGYDLGRP